MPKKSRSAKLEPGEIRDYDQFLSKKGFTRKLKPRTIFGIDQPFNLYICGKKGTGKTNLTCALIFEHQKFDNIVYVAQKIEEDKLMDILVPGLNYDDEGEEKEEPVVRLMTDKEFMLYNDGEPFNIDTDFNYDDPETQNLIVFDDATKYSKELKSLIEDIIIRCRKNNISLIVISHTYHMVSPIIRNNMDAMALFRQGDKHQRQTLVNELAGEVLPKEEIAECFRKATADGHGFLFVDQRYGDENIPRYIRKNLNMGWKKIDWSNVI